MKKLLFKNGFINPKSVTTALHKERHMFIFVNGEAFSFVCKKEKADSLILYFLMLACGETYADENAVINKLEIKPKELVEYIADCILLNV